MLVENRTSLPSELVEEIKRYCQFNNFTDCWQQTKNFTKFGAKMNINTYTYTKILGRDFDRFKYSVHCKHQTKFNTSYYLKCANPYHLILVSRVEVKKHNKKKPISQLTQLPLAKSMVTINPLTKLVKSLPPFYKNEFKKKYYWTVLEESAKSLIYDNEKDAELLQKKLENMIAFLDSI